MTSIYKTAYPYFSGKKKISKELVARNYRLTHEELLLVKKDSGDSPDLQLTYAVMFMVFKNFNYFPDLTSIPNEVIKNILEQLKISGAELNTCHSSTISRYKNKIRKHYRVIAWSETALDENNLPYKPSHNAAIKYAAEASEKHNYLADIINIIIEQLKKNYFELPTFKQLDRIASDAKTRVNKELFAMIDSSLTDTQKNNYDQLLQTTVEYNRSSFNAIKSLPKNPTISNFRALLKHHDWLEGFGDISAILGEIIPIKLKQFAMQAKSLDASDLKDFSPSKRYALISCLILQAQTKAKDALATTFCKTVMRMHKKAKNKLESLREFYRNRTQELLVIFSELLSDMEISDSNKGFADGLERHGGVANLKADCHYAIALNSNNHFPFLFDFFKNCRGSLIKLLETLDIRSSTQENSLTDAIKFIIQHKGAKKEYVEDSLDLSFATGQWKKLIIKNSESKVLLHHRHLELCVLSQIAIELNSKDLFVVGADSYADYRLELLSEAKCNDLLNDYCSKIDIPSNGYECVNSLKETLLKKSMSVDKLYPKIKELTIDKSGKATLHKRQPRNRPSSAIWLEKMLKDKMKKRNLIDVFCSSYFYCNWGDELHPISGAKSKIKDVAEKYLLTTFAYGTGMGPTQTSLHVKGATSAHTLSWINRRHITPEMLDKAREKLINLINKFNIVKSWGDGKSVAADGTMEELREQNLIAEFHFRYRKHGGIAYHHVANNYILLFSTFMSCGVWEAVEIIEGLLKNKSDIQPEIIHGDTQAQSTVVFALAYLLGFKLMPRIRNWQDLKLFRPDKTTKYKNIDLLFTQAINWDLIEKHWQDMMQVVLSIREGKISSSKILRKLSSNSKKNRLYQAFQELGYVIRTLFLLEYISDVELRETITANTNKVEAYNALSDWCAFGSDILTASNDDVEMEKAVKYNDLLANAVILQNVSDMTNTIAELITDGANITKEDMSYLCPYWTKHLKRFGEIVLDFTGIPKNIDLSRSMVLW